MENTLNEIDRPAGEMAVEVEDVHMEEAHEESHDDHHGEDDHSH